MNKDDAVVERVRTAHRRIAEKCGPDIHALFEWAKRIESQHPDRVVGFERINGGRKLPKSKP